MSKAIEDYVQEHAHRWDQKYKDQIRAFLNILVEYCGPERQLGTITKRDTQEIKKVVRALPQNRLWQSPRNGTTINATRFSQRTDTVNALRGHLAELGLIAPVGIKNVERLKSMMENSTEKLPRLVMEMADLHFSCIDALSTEISGINERISTDGKSGETTRLLRTMPGVGPISAMVMEAFSPETTTFGNGRDFAAWLGLIPRQHSSGGKSRLGQTIKMGQKDIRRMRVTGAMSRRAGYVRQGSRAEPWLQDKPDRKPKMVAAVALANKMARRIRAMSTKRETYKTHLRSVA